MPEDEHVKPPMPTSNVPSSYFEGCVGEQELLIKDIIRRIELLERDLHGI
jgi:hypothetical protein